MKIINKDSERAKSLKKNLKKLLKRKSDLPILSTGSLSEIGIYIPTSK